MGTNTRIFLYQISCLRKDLVQRKAERLFKHCFVRDLISLPLIKSLLSAQGVPSEFSVELHNIVSDDYHIAEARRNVGENDHRFLLREQYRLQMSALIKLLDRISAWVEREDSSYKMSRAIEEKKSTLLRAAQQGTEILGNWLYGTLRLIEVRLISSYREKADRKLGECARQLRWLFERHYPPSSEDVERGTSILTEIKELFDATCLGVTPENEQPLLPDLLFLDHEENIVQSVGPDRECVELDDTLALQCAENREPGFYMRRSATGSWSFTHLSPQTVKIIRHLYDIRKSPRPSRSLSELAETFASGSRSSISNRINQLRRVCITLSCKPILESTPDSHWMLHLSLDSCTHSPNHSPTSR